MSERNLVAKLREALKKDFANLYVPKFTTAWREERLVRTIEIDIMQLDNLVKAVERNSSVPVDAVLKKSYGACYLTNEKGLILAVLTANGWQWFDDWPTKDLSTGVDDQGNDLVASDRNAKNSTANPPKQGSAGISKEGEEGNGL